MSRRRLLGKRQRHISLKFTGLIALQITPVAMLFLPCWAQSFFALMSCMGQKFRKALQVLYCLPVSLMLEWYPVLVPGTPAP